jgi:hypothetical protein
MEFYQTGTGRKFFEHDFPELVIQLERIADALEEITIKQDIWDNTKGDKE